MAKTGDSPETSLVDALDFDAGLGQTSREMQTQPEERPLCKCHGEPMNKAGRNQSRWRCRIKAIEANRRWHEANPGRGADRSRAYREAHPERVRARDRDYSRAYRESHPEQTREAARIYSRTHRPEINATNRARMQRLRDEGRCVYCGKPSLTEWYCWDCLLKKQEYNLYYKMVNGR